MGYNGKSPSTAKRVFDTTTTELVGDGTMGPYVNSKTITAEQIDIRVGGAWQSPTAYSIAGANITFTSLVPIGVSISIKNRADPTGIATPGTGQVISTDIIAGAVDLTHFADGTPGNLVTFNGTGIPVSSDPYTLVPRTDQGRIQENSWRIAEASGSAIYNMVDGISDSYVDETGIDTAGSTNETYNAAGNYYTQPGVNMTLISNAYTASTQPVEAYVAIQHESIVAVVLNTEFIISVSRDGGATWTAGTVVDQGQITVDPTTDGTSKILTDIIDISGQPAGTSMKYKITTANLKEQRIHSVALQWR